MWDDGPTATTVLWSRAVGIVARDGAVAVHVVGVHEPLELFLDGQDHRLSPAKL